MGIVALRTADIYVDDVDRALDFYVDVLGFERRADDPVDDDGHRWVEVAPPGSQTALVLACGFGTWSADKVGGWSRTIFEVDDMDTTAARLRAHDVAFDEEPEAAPWGVYAQVRDPDGNILGLLEPVDE